MESADRRWIHGFSEPASPSTLLLRLSPRVPILRRILSRPARAIR